MRSMIFVRHFDVDAFGKVKNSLMSSYIGGLNKDVGNLKDLLDVI